MPDYSFIQATHATKSLPNSQLDVWLSQDLMNNLVPKDEYDLRTNNKLNPKFVDSDSINYF